MGIQMILSLRVNKDRMQRDQHGQEVFWKHAAKFWLCVEEESENI